MDFSLYNATEFDESKFCAGFPAEKQNQLSLGIQTSIEPAMGGPLICQEGDNAVLAGVTSVHSMSVKRGHPGVYTNIFAIKDWIESQIS